MSEQNDRWICRILNEETANKLSPKELRIIAKDIEKAKIQAKDVWLNSRDMDDSPVDNSIELPLSAIECMPLGDWERGEPWPSDKVRRTAE